MSPGAAGAVGQAAIQRAHAKGAQVIALVKDAPQLWVAESGGVEAIAQSDQGDPAAIAYKATGGKGANLALNGVGSSIFASIRGSLAVGGRQVVYSAAGGREFPLDLMAFYKQQGVLLGLDTQKLDVTFCAGVLNEIGPLFESKALKSPLVGERYPLVAAAQAYGRVAAGQGAKIVLVMP